MSSKKEQMISLWGQLTVEEQDRVYMRWWVRWAMKNKLIAGLTTVLLAGLLVIAFKMSPEAAMIAFAVGTLVALLIQILK